MLTAAPARYRIRPFVALTKPRIIELLLVTTVPTMVVAERGLPSIWLMVATVIGGTLAAGGANAYNMYLDRDIDALMKRTAGRPLVTGEVEPNEALIFATALEAVAFLWLALFVNLLSAVLALAACAFYVVVYTIWLKRTSTQNIVIGGAAGAVPVLIGWSSVTNSLGWEAIILFGVIFFWTPPHFWALAIKYEDDYSAASVPMLPVVETHRHTTNQMTIYAGHRRVADPPVLVGGRHGLDLPPVGHRRRRPVHRRSPGPAGRDRPGQAVPDGHPVLRILDHPPHRPVRRPGHRPARRVGNMTVSISGRRAGYSTARSNGNTGPIGGSDGRDSTEIRVGATTPGRAPDQRF